MVHGDGWGDTVRYGALCWLWCFYGTVMVLMVLSRPYCGVFWCLWRGYKDVMQFGLVYGAFGGG